MLVTMENSKKLLNGLDCKISMPTSFFQQNTSILTNILNKRIDFIVVFFDCYEEKKI